MLSNLFVRARGVAKAAPVPLTRTASVARRFTDKAAPRTNSSIIGIDLGTTNSCVALMEGGSPRVLANNEGKRTTPSVVAFTADGQRLVGDTARRQFVTNPTNTFFATKRLIGRRFDDPATQKDMKHLPYKVVKGPNGDAWVESFGKQYSPSQIGAIILSKMKETAEKHLGRGVAEAVITVPAYFNDQQRQATRDAGQIAGLNVRRIINEPTAAALHFGQAGHAGEEGQLIAVYDLGGGTFDVSILQIDNSVFQVLSTNGDTSLGGEDFDHAISTHVIEWFKAQEGIDLSKEMLAVQRIRESAEKAKMELDAASSTDIDLPFICMHNGQPKHLKYKFTKDAFNKLTKPLLLRSEGPCKQALKDAKVTASDIKQVLLVGGMTRTPAVQELVQNLFGRAPSKAVNPDEVVASGAAVQGAVLSGEVKDIVLIDVTPLSLGTSDSQGAFVRLINRNTAIPAKASKRFTTVHDGQSAIQCQVLQGEREMAKDNKLLGEFTLPGIPPAKRGVPQIEISFEIDANGIVKATARDAGTGISRDIRVQTSGGLTTAEVERMVKEAEKFAESDKVFKELLGLRNNAESLCYNADVSLVEHKDKISTELHDSIEKEVKAMREYLHSTKDSQDEPKKMVEEMTKRTEKLQEVVFKIGDSMYKNAAPKEGEGESKQEGEKKK